MVHNFYLRVLKRYEQKSNCLNASLMRTLIRWAVEILRRRQGFHFPRRAIGGRWSSERCRFEMLMRWFQYESVKRVPELIRPGMTTMDIGAHFGYYTRLLAELVGPTGRVLAFEPNPENFAILQRNLAPRRYRNVVLFNYAAGGQDGVKPCCVPPGNSNRRPVQGCTEAERILPVQCVRLDTVLEQRGIEAVDFIRIDTKGAEPLALDGLQRTIARSPQLRMLMEYSPKALGGGNFEPGMLLERLRWMGFEVEMISSDPATQDTGRSILCRRSEKIPQISMEDVFAPLFSGNSAWESYSGPGSSLAYTAAARAELPALIKELGARTFLDIPCGDLHWMKQVDLDVEKYIGADVIRKLIETNRRRFGDETRTFLVLDVTKDPLPETEVVFCRDCLPHLSNQDIFRAIANIRQSGSKYLLTTTFPGRERNEDIITGYWRPLNLQKEPFCLPEPLRLINENYTGGGGAYTDKSLGLWRIDML